MLPAGQDHLHHEDVAGGLTFLGLQAMMDPPRAEAIDAIKACQTAGVTVKMITGDHAVTATAIARQIGIARRRRRGEAVTGAEMAALHDREFIDLAQRVNVFARVTPEQKLRLVEALQSRGLVVAMTGDGVNDAPALKQADIGVAMGITGTDVAKDAADMVLTDDNFASIEAAVEEGRGVFDNLVKFIAYALPTNVGQGLVLIAAILLGITLPILPLQILWINMITAVLLGLGLAFELKEPGIMQRQPRAPRSPIISTAVLVRIGVAGVILLIGAFALFEWSQAIGGSVEEARTVAVNVFMSVQIFYLFACRSLRRSLFTLQPVRQPHDRARRGRGRLPAAGLHLCAVHERRLRHAAPRRHGMGDDRPCRHRGHGAHGRAGLAPAQAAHRLTPLEVGGRQLGERTHPDLRAGPHPPAE